MLKGEPLFPSLRHLQIEDFRLTLDYFAFLASPAIEHIRIDSKEALDSPKHDDVKESVLACVAQLALYSPRTRSLCMEKNMSDMPVSLLQSIRSFRELRALKLQCFLLVMQSDLDSCLQCLESLPLLEVLSMRVKEPVAGGQSCAETHLPESNDTESITTILPSVSDLDISGPFWLVSGMMTALCSTALEVLSISFSTPPTPCPRSQMSLGYLRNIGLLKRVTLIGIGSLPVWDLGSLKQATDLESLCVRDCFVMSLAQLFERTVWPRLVSLELPSSVEIDFPQLQKIMQSSPSLRSLSLRLPDAKGSWLPDPIESTQVPPHHGLENLHVLAPPPLQRQDAPAESPEPMPDIDLNAWVSPLMTVAHYLSALFPSLQSLTAKCDANEWDIIFRTIQSYRRRVVNHENRRSLSSE